MLKKLVVSLFVLLCGAAALDARTIYITRHGQVGDRAFYDPVVKETKITEMGRDQANRVAKFIANRKFDGNIYVSPFYRTIETGIVIAGHFGGRKVILEPGLQEMAHKRAGRCMSLKEITERFPGAFVPGKAFTDNWRLGGEDPAARLVRVEKMFERLLAEDKGDIIVVSHGATVGSMVKALNKRCIKGVNPIKGMAWNCSLFIFELNDKDQVTSAVYTTEYMPDEMLTHNFKLTKIPRPDDPRYAKPAPKKSKKK